MHGIYKIRVKLAHTGATVCEYTGKTHPRAGEYLNINGKNYTTLQATHCVESYPDSRGTTHLLEYVEISVASGPKL